MMPTLTFDPHGFMRQWRQSPRRLAAAGAMVLLLAVVAAVLAWTFAQQGEDGPASRPGVAVGTGGAPAASPAEPAPTQNVADIFAVRTWEPELVMAPPSHGSATAPVEVEPPPPPEPPPLPFRYLGRIVEPGKPPAFMLSDGKETLIVRVGDVVGGDYKIEQFQGGDLVFLYQPMNIRQALAIGEQP